MRAQLGKMNGINPLVCTDVKREEEEEQVPQEREEDNTLVGKVVESKADCERRRGGRDTDSFISSHSFEGTSLHLTSWGRVDSPG